MGSTMTSVEVATEYVVSKIHKLKPCRERSPAEADYHILIPELARAFMMEGMGVSSDQAQTFTETNRAEFAPFLDAAWELCRRGLLRPGRRWTQRRSGQGADEDLRFTISAKGAERLNDPDWPIETILPGRLAQMFTTQSQTLGPGFLQRAQEAVRCHHAMAYLAACVMCGAAAESILLQVAIVKKSDETGMLKLYNGRDGRRRITEIVVTGLQEHLARPIKFGAELLSYWRDDAAHGQATTISEVEADVALVRLL